MSSKFKIDYKALDVKVGLEIHIQLDSKRKLFCECPPIIRNDPPHFRIVRRLRPTLSELGQYDPAAIWEFKKHKTYIYEGYHDTTCLVELDEEPPHDPDPYSLETALIVAKMFNMKIFDELYVMRKIVIDGSNVSGFQRTILVAYDGLVKFFGYKVPIWTLALEEDAARKIEETEEYVVYRLDRLGIPLIEISTGPLQYSPEQIMEIAYYLGHSVKLTKRAKRGIGTVRQDLNISIKGGAKTEIKGIPDLSLIPKVIEYEVLRQLNLLKIRDELINRGVKENEINWNVYDVTDVFTLTKSSIMRRIIENGGKILALKLPKGFEGLLKFEVQPGRRFGTELADYVRAWTYLKGIIHSDELPAYGISKNEVSKITERIGSPVFILIAGTNDKDLNEAIEILIQRLRHALIGVPEETRAANPDGTTRFTRPRPGAARMYPETDLRPIKITFELISEIEKRIPESIELIVNKYVSYGISKELAFQVIKSTYFEIIDRLIEEFKEKISPTIIAATFTNTLKMIQKDGYDITKLREDHFEKIFQLLAEKVITKEAIPELLKKLCENPDKDVQEIIKELNLFKLNIDEVKKIIKSILNEIKTFDEKKIFSIIMSRYRGRVDVDDIKHVLNELKSTFLKS